ncbi:ABC transporter permease [Brucella sp. NBRC 12950]|uniref:ABC transporter permease n=1 Tax=Brucella sp. NBRC 12950 TaxID=2994518 RepID=UPI0024A0E3CC|nr:ABC transporter permease [Brucella sp. NBRC 12950]GLU29831.1 spermidine/putrescine ABC transporter permease [Brucella sp. NBRC 12950]
MLRLYVGLFLFMLFAPIVLIGLFSFNGSEALTFPIESLSLRWYQAMFSDPQLLNAFKNSLIVGVATTVITTILGSMTAIGLARVSGRTKTVLSLLTFFPIALPGLFVGIALLIMIAQFGIQRSLITVTLAHVLITIPFFVESSRSRLEYFDLSLEEAARDLGAGPLTAFRLVTLPIIAPTLLGAAILSFAISFDEVIITIFVSGNESTLPLFIWSMMRRSVTPLINAASMLALGSILITIVGLGILLWWQRKRTLLQRSRNFEV